MSGQLQLGNIAGNSIGCKISDKEEIHLGNVRLYCVSGLCCKRADTLSTTRLQTTVMYIIDFVHTFTSKEKEVENVTFCTPVKTPSYPSELCYVDQLVIQIYLTFFVYKKSQYGQL